MHISTRGALLRGVPLLTRAYTRDAMTFDQATVDSAGAFLQGELERFGNRTYEPLYSVTWSRDIDLRTDVTLADESTSFALLQYGAQGNTRPGGKSWVGRTSNVIGTTSVDLEKQIQPMTTWARQAQWSVPELLRAQQLNRPIDTLKMQVIDEAWDLETDEQVYIGDTDLGVTGMVNRAGVATANVTGGTWATKVTTDAGRQALLADVNDLLNAAWAATGWKYVPTKLLLPPVQFGLIASTFITSAGNISVMEFLRQNSVTLAITGRPLDIQPLKWLTAAARGAGSDRMVAYTQDEKLIRFPRVGLQNIPLQYRDLHHIATKWGQMGVVEIPYPEAIAYRDGI